jgi:hypothetical protein
MLKSLLPGSLVRPLEFQRDQVSELLRQKRLKPDWLTQELKRHFDKAIVAVYRGMIDDSLKESGADLFAIAERLLKNKGVLNRWLNDKAVPDWETVYLAIAAFDLDVRQIGFPRGREAVVAALRKSLEVVRERLSPKRSLNCPPDRNTIVCLHYAVFNPQWWNAQRTRDPKHLVAATDTIRRKAARQAPSLVIDSHEDIERIIEPWGSSWLIFHSAIPYGWQYPEVEA